MQNRPKFENRSPNIVAPTALPKYGLTYVEGDACENRSPNKDPMGKAEGIVRIIVIPYWNGKTDGKHETIETTEKNTRKRMQEGRA